MIVLTSNRDEDVAATLKKFQVKDILFKPVTPEELLAALEKALATP